MPHKVLGKSRHRQGENVLRRVSGGCGGGDVLRTNLDLILRVEISSPSVIGEKVRTVWMNVKRFQVKGRARNQARPGGSWVFCDAKNWKEAK